MTQFPEALKDWRARRRLSQLELASEAGVSARHVAFLETGRARPSAAMVVRLAEALQIPMSDRNTLLTQAGFAARYPGRRWSDADMAPMRAAVERILGQHAPYPGIAVDRMWTVRLMNGPAARLFGPLGLAEGGSLVDLMLSESAPLLIENWPDVARRAASRLRIESASQGGVPALERAADRLGAVTGPVTDAPGPVTPTILRLGDRRLSLFAVIAQFGTPEDLLLEDLRIELFFPTDDRSRQALQDLSPQTDREVSCPQIGSDL